MKYQKMILWAMSLPMMAYRRVNLQVINKQCLSQKWKWAIDRFLVIGGLLVVQWGHAQTQITLKPVKFEINSPSFYIQEVIDGRKNKQNIGYTKNNLDEKIAVELTPEAPKAIQTFVNQSLVQTSQTKPVLLQILYLQVKEAQTSTSEVTARAEIKLAFYEKEQSKLKRIYTTEHYEDEVFAISRKAEIAGTHERRIRSLLEHCLVKFAEEKQAKRLVPEYLDPKMLHEPSGVDELVITKDFPLGHWHHLVTFKRSMGHHTQGWQLSYIGFSDKEEVIVPFIFSLGQSQVKEATTQGSEYRMMDAYTLSFGSQVYIKLLPNIYANVTLNVPVGVEILRDRQGQNSQNFLIGIGSRQGIMYIPRSALGLVLGASVFQRLQTSRIFNTDWGFAFEVGIKF